MSYQTSLPKTDSHAHHSPVATYEPKEHKLSNGVPVILQHYDGPAAATYWWNCVGSADELPFQAGFSHFLEHMLFKDTDVKEKGGSSTGELARAIESLGGDINAYTSLDQTVYHVTCAEQHWEKIIKSFATMAKPQKFSKKDFDSEREVILEELKKNEDSPSRMLFQELFYSIYNKHPYRNPVIGFVKTLKAAKVQQLMDYYENFYTAHNMGLILVGPLTEAREKTLLAWAEKEFGSKVFKSKKFERPARTNDKEVATTPQFRKLAFDVKTPSLIMGFRVPDLHHADIPALDLLASILGMGESSRLYQKLFVEKALVTDASSGLYILKDPGIFYLQIDTTETKQMLPAIQLALEVIEKLKNEGPTEEEMKRVITVAESERLYATQSADGLASRIGFLKFVTGNLSHDEKYLGILKNVTPEQIKQVAAKYFDYKRFGGAIMVPLKEKSYDTKPIVSLLERKLTLKEEKTSAKPTASKTYKLPLTHFETKSGMRVALVERPNSHVVGVHISALGGVRYENSKNWGLSSLMSQTWTKGTENRNSKQIAGEVEGLAANLGGFSGKNSIGLQMTGLAKDFTKLTPVLIDIATRANFPESEVDHSKRVALDSIQSIEDHSSQLCSKLFIENLFGEHPYSQMSIGTKETVERLTGSELKRTLNNWWKPSKLNVSISGRITRPEVEDFLAELEAGFNSKTETNQQSFSKPTIKAPEPLKAPRIIEKTMKREQSHIIVGGFGLSMHDEDRDAMKVLQTILGGQSGRLFIEIREKKSLCYTVAPMQLDGIETGYVGTYIGCSPEKKKKALEGIQLVYEALAKKGPTASELTRAKELYLGSRAMELQGDHSIAAFYGLERLYDFSMEETEGVRARIESVTAEQIRKIIEKYYLKPYMVTSIVG
ncbi:MAG: insulinase family protein [Xanthomonadaceae bacterium]|nr:insulinase family protein [Xanthomonadaceae bacterium]